MDDVALLLHTIVLVEFVLLKLGQERLQLGVCDVLTEVTTGIYDVDEVKDFVVWVAAFALRHVLMTHFVMVVEEVFT